MKHEAPWKKVLLKVVAGFFVILMLAIGAILLFVGLIFPLDAAEHYRRAYQDPVTVTASVTKHDTYDDDGDTDYRSYISYTVNGVSYILLYLRYPMVMWTWITVAAGICGFLWLYFVYRAGCRMRRLRNGEYTLSRDRLVEKTCDTDSDGHDTYTLHYSSGDKTWRHNTTRQYYEKAQVGTEVLAVYLPGEKKPLCHYDQEGAAC